MTASVDSASSWNGTIGTRVFGEGEVAPPPSLVPSSQRGFASSMPRFRAVAGR